MQQNTYERLMQKYNKENLSMTFGDWLANYIEDLESKVEHYEYILDDDLK